MTPGVSELQPRGQLPVFVNKVLLKHSHTRVSAYCLRGCFCAAMTELSSCHRDQIAHKAWNSYNPALEEKDGRSLYYPKFSLF